MNFFKKTYKYQPCKRLLLPATAKSVHLSNKKVLISAAVCLYTFLTLLNLLLPLFSAEFCPKCKAFALPYTGGVL
jgi:hypothetical protein